MGRTRRADRTRWLRAGAVTARSLFNRALMNAVAARPGVTLAASIYAAAEQNRTHMAVAAAEAGLWVHADVIVSDGVHRGVDLGLIRELAAHRIGPIDVHVIVEDTPLDALLDQICAIRVDRITVPLEAIADIPAATEKIRASGAAPWLAIAPATDPVDALIHLPHIDGVLVMLIQPGSSGQADQTLTLKAEDIASRAIVGVDGGVNRTNIDPYLDAGARYIVSGRGLLTDHDPEGATWTRDLLR